METSIFELIADKGAFALLSFYMIYYVLKTSGERENKLQNIIEKFADRFDVFEDKLDKVEREVKDIKKE